MKKFLIALTILSTSIALAEETSNSSIAVDTTIELKKESKTSIKRSTLCEKIENREPIGSTVKFNLNDKAWYFNEVRDGKYEKAIYHTWYHITEDETKEMAKIKLRVDGTRWRTYSSKNLFLSGKWLVKVTTKDGVVLAEENLEVLEANNNNDTEDEEWTIKE